MKRILYCFVIIAFFNLMESQKLLAQFKTVAYVPNWIDLNAFATTIDYSKVTHLNIAFENPDASGNLSYNSGNTAIITRAHSNGVKVLVSICGGAASQDATMRNRYFSLISDANRASFVQKIVSYINNRGFDGIDVDLEGPAINADYGDFIADLANALKPQGKLVTAALSQGYGGPNVPSSTFAHFNWINIMAYDATGPWDPSNPGQHSSYSFAVSNVDYWVNRGLAKSKAILGLPFYGYGFGSAFRSDEWSYKEIVATYAGAETRDQSGSTIWYNGIPTIKAKTQYAKDQALGGVMIWQLASDATGTKSLLLAISQVIGSNAPPVANITSPSNGASFTAPATITINATASDANGTISKVDFFNGSTLLGTDTSSPYSFTWSNVSAGSYSLTARATDNAGATGTSSAVSITVSGPPSCQAAVASADDGNVATNVLDGNLATRWSASGDPQWIQFCLDATTPKNVNGIKIAFYSGNVRQSKFDIQTSLDGISWSNALTNQLSSGTSLNLETFPFATRSAKWVRILGHGNTVNLWNSYTEVQVQIVTANNPPSVSITSPTNGASFVVPANITINAAASDSDGSITSVSFYEGSNLLGTDNTAPYSFTWANVGAGNYSLTARATDNAGATTTSAAVSITTVNNTPPSSVSITSPANGATFTAPATVNITASAFDSDGTISQVSFYNGATLLGSDNTSPYSFSWTNVAAGTYSLVARATDNHGANTTSSAVSITVNPAPAGLPAPWVNADIGAVGAAGSATHSSGTFTVNGSGADIWGTADEFHYVHQSASGDIELIARVSSISNTHAWAKAGLMVRESLAAGSINAAVFVSSASGVTFQRRTATGGTSVSTVVAGVTAPIYLKLTRSGNNFTASYSTNGTTYTTIGTQAVTMGASTQVGLAVTSHLDGTIASAPFTNVSVTGPVAPCPAVIDSGNDGNVAANVLDNDMLTRWSSSGDGQWIQFCLGTVNTVSAVDIAFYKGNERQSIFDVLVSTDGTTWVNAATGLRSSGTSLAFENFTFAGKPGKYVRILGHGNSLNLWNSYTEVRITSSPVSLKVADESASSENLILKPYPNPASEKVAISYTIKQAGRVKLTVFNSGNHRTETLVDEIKDSGTHETILDTQDFKSGLHVIKIIQNGEMRVQKLIKK